MCVMLLYWRPQSVGELLHGLEPDEAGVLVLGDGTTADVVACGTAPTAAAAAMTPNNAVRSSDDIFFSFLAGEIYNEEQGW